MPDLDENLLAEARAGDRAALERLLEVHQRRVFRFGLKMCGGEEVKSALQSAIAALDPMYREVLVLRDVEGLSAPEVAEILGLSVEAVKSRLHRARVSVRERIAPILGIPEPTPRA